MADKRSGIIHGTDTMSENQLFKTTQTSCNKRHAVKDQVAD